MHAAVGRQQALEVQGVGVERDRLGIDTEHPTEPQHHPLERRGAHDGLGLGLVRAVQVGVLHRHVRGHRSGRAVRIAGTEHRVARGLHESRGSRLSFRDADQGRGGVDVDPPGQCAVLVDRRRDDRREVDDHRRSHVGDQALRSVRRRSGPPSERSTPGQATGWPPCGWRGCRGRR